MGDIYSAICGVMEDIGAIGKNDTNKQQGFKYRGIDAVMNALNPAMLKHKIFCVPEVLEQRREERTTAKGATLIYSVCRIRYTFFTTDGSSVQATVIGEGMDSGDKASNKAMAVAFKYACFQTFCIPTENLMDDPDAETPENSRKNSQNPEERNPVNPPKGTHSGQTENSRKQGDAWILPPEKIKKLNDEIERTGVEMGSVLGMFGVSSFKELTETQYEVAMKKFKKTKDRDKAV